MFQGVHMILDGDHQRPWKDGEKRDSRLVFIGRNLPEEKIRKGFESCVVRASNAVIPASRLRARATRSADDVLLASNRDRLRFLGHAPFGALHRSDEQTTRPR